MLSTLPQHYTPTLIPGLRAEYLLKYTNTHTDDRISWPHHQHIQLRR
jgi:hypothetical protein